MNRDQPIRKDGAAMIACKRVPVYEWLRTVETAIGPMPPELRHLCYVLARLMTGDGHDGCYPGTRELGVRIGVAHTTVGRRLRRLCELGWLDVEPRTCQYGRRGARYFPSLPLEHHSVPMSEAIGTPGRSNKSIGTSALASNGTRGPIIGTAKAIIGTPSVFLTLLQTPTEKSAAPPPPAAAGSAARRAESESERRERLRAEVANLRRLNFTEEEIADVIRTHYDPRPTKAEIEAVPR